MLDLTSMALLTWMNECLTGARNNLKSVLDQLVNDTDRAIISYCCHYGPACGAVNQGGSVAL